MKRAEISIIVSGEAYDLSGDPERIRRALVLFREILERIKTENRGKDISTHRLGTMAALALAEKLVIGQDRREKIIGRVDSVQKQVKGLIEILEKFG